MANSYEAIGTLHEVMPTQQVKDTFRKREFVLRMMDGQYEQHIKFQVTQDRCALLDTYRPGQEIKVTFNLRGRPFTGKDGSTMYFTNLEAWRIEAATASAPGSEFSQMPSESVAPTTATFDDDVPF
jgi:hypothetical protein